jgi:subtilase-type serine protease
MRRRRIHARLLQSVALIVFTSASVSVANAQANTNGANVNALNLLAPFLTLNATPIGQETLQTSLETVISINNGATPTEVQTAFSDALNLMSGTSNRITLSDDTHQYYGPAANLAGGLPAQKTVDGIIPQQPVGGFGSVLGPIYQNGVCNDPNAPCTNPQLSSTVTLLTTANEFIFNDLDLAKCYFANGSISQNGCDTKAVAPAGYTLPTFNGLPNKTDSVYDLAYGVTNTQPGQDIYGNGAT